MAKGIKLERLGDAIGKELTLYHEDVVQKVNALSEQAAKDLVEKTKATAPVGYRGSYKKHIASKLVRTKRGNEVYAWYVKPPDHRLTHLLVHGHATKDGGRTKADPFLQNAMDAVLPDYVKNVEEALK